MAIRNTGEIQHLSDYVRYTAIKSQWPSGNTLAFHAENPDSTPSLSDINGDYVLMSVERTKYEVFYSGLNVAF
jgi:hypothetical protein